MSRNQSIRMFAWVGLACLTCSFLGCQSTALHDEAVTTQNEVGQFPDEQALADAVEPGGARLWSQNCMRCHNLRPPRERSDRQWAVIAHHMRVRANVTAQEHREILKFLQAAN